MSLYEPKAEKVDGVLSHSHKSAKLKEDFEELKAGVAGEVKGRTSDGRCLLVNENVSVWIPEELLEEVQ